MQTDFKKLRTLAEKMDLFKTNPWFYILHFTQLIVFDLIATYIIYKSGYANWFTYFIAVAFLVATQVNLTIEKLKKIKCVVSQGTSWLAST